MAEKKDGFIGFQYPNIKEWPKIVDDTHFRTTSEIKRDMIASGNIGAGEKGLFDYELESRITPDNIISDVITAVITKESAEKLGLAEGDDVTAIIKSTEVIIGK